MMASQPSLSKRLEAAGIDASGDPFDLWCRLHGADPERTTIIDLYALVAAPRGVQPHELPVGERLTLARRAEPIAWAGFAVTEGSDRPDDVLELVEYDPGWPDAFDRWRAVIAGCLGEVSLRVEHVGSTAVPGLLAKPTIDVQVSVKDIRDEVAYVDVLEKAGLQLRSRDDAHRFFRPFADRPRAVHVHVCDLNSEWERRHMLFRDYLREHPDAAATYAADKVRAARIWHDDRIAYTEEKTAVIADILAAADVWATATGWDVPIASA